MSRGLTDEPLPPEPEDDNQAEIDNIISELIKGQNKLHDRLVDLERQVDHLVAANQAPVNTPKQKWKRGL